MVVGPRPEGGRTSAVVLGRDDEVSFLCSLSNVELCEGYGVTDG